MRDKLAQHSPSGVSPNRDSPAARRRFAVPAQLQSVSPFFNASLLKDHGDIKARYGSLKRIKEDLAYDPRAQSKNPLHAEHAFFSSPERLLQSSGTTTEIDPEILKLPAYINWAEEGKTTRIKYQGKCRSCYAFSGLAAVESAILIKWALTKIQQQHRAFRAGNSGLWNRSSLSTERLRGRTARGSHEVHQRQGHQHREELPL